LRDSASFFCCSASTWATKAVARALVGLDGGEVLLAGLGQSDRLDELLLTIGEQEYLVASGDDRFDLARGLDAPSRQPLDLDLLDRVRAVLGFDARKRPLEEPVEFLGARNDHQPGRIFGIEVRLELRLELRLEPQGTPAGNQFGQLLLDQLVLFRRLDQVDEAFANL
jgi:hypothetical protein